MWLYIGKTGCCVDRDDQYKKAAKLYDDAANAFKKSKQWDSAGGNCLVTLTHFTVRCWSQQRPS